MTTTRTDQSDERDRDEGVDQPTGQSAEPTTNVEEDLEPVGAPELSDAELARQAEQGPQPDPAEPDGGEG